MMVGQAQDHTELHGKNSSESGDTKRLHLETPAQISDRKRRDQIQAILRDGAAIADVS